MEERGKWGAAEARGSKEKVRAGADLNPVRATRSGDARTYTLRISSPRMSAASVNLPCFASRAPWSSLGVGGADRGGRDGARRDLNRRLTCDAPGRSRGAPNARRRRGAEEESKRGTGGGVRGGQAGAEGAPELQGAVEVRRDGGEGHSETEVGRNAGGKAARRLGEREERGATEGLGGCASPARPTRQPFLRPPFGLSYAGLITSCAAEVLRYVSSRG